MSANNGKLRSSVDLHLGRTLRRLREQAGLSQAHLAANLAMPLERLQEFETGARRIRACELWEIARFFEVQPVYFFGGIGSLEPERIRLTVRRPPTRSATSSSTPPTAVANDNDGRDA